MSAPLSVFSNPDPLDLAEADVIVAPIVEAGGFGIGVAGHALGNLDPATVGQVIGDPGRAEGMASDGGLDLCVAGSSADHVPDIGTGERTGESWPVRPIAARNRGPLRSVFRPAAARYSSR